MSLFFSRFIRRILGAESFPLRPLPQSLIEPQDYQPPLVSKQAFPPPPAPAPLQEP